MSTSKTAGSRSRGSAARAEGRKKTVTFEGETFKIPTKLPFEVMRYVRGNDLDFVGVLEVVVGSEQMERVWGLGLDIDKGRELVNALLEPYGISAGE